MQQKGFFSSSLTLAALFALTLLTGQPRRAEAGCGCDKPAPAPATIIPNAAFSGMQVTLFNSSLQNGQKWTLTFQNGANTVTTSAVVGTKRTLTDPTGRTYQPQLVVTVPKGLPMGPTQILATSGGMSFTVPDSSFTLIGQPIAMSGYPGMFSYKGYATGIGADGTLYLSISGFENVCLPSGFATSIKNYPLRFSNGTAVIVNRQGFLINALDQQNGTYYSLSSSTGTTSDVLYYYRHSFDQYCAAHLPGGVKEVDVQDPNWHLDGTAHTAYDTLIFAVAGHFADGSLPQPGSVTFDVDMGALVVTGSEPWAAEQEEEHIQGSTGSTSSTTNSTGSPKTTSGKGSKSSSK